MIELKRNQLKFSFPEIHPQAVLTVEMQRTLRIPDNDKTYPLPPGLGPFPLQHIDDFASQLPESWRRRGGVMTPMYQSEALWLNFDSKFLPSHGTAYPFAIKISTGKVNAVNGQTWTNDLDSGDQDYMVSSVQPWLDGYCVEKGLIRQFVAMPLGSGYTAEEQITGKAEFGGIQIKVFPMFRTEFDKRFPAGIGWRRSAPAAAADDFSQYFCLSEASIGLAPGGRMRQEIHEDPYGYKVWDQDISSRCFVHLANSMVWESITGKKPPSPAITAATYSKYGLPWFEYYSEQPAIRGSDTLNDLKSVREMGDIKGDQPLPENESAFPENIKVIVGKRSKHQVREGSF